MTQIEQLVYDGVINKEQLVLKRHQYLNLDLQQAQFVSKLFRNSSLNFSNLTLQEISKEFGTDEKTAQVILQTLLSESCIQLVNIEGVVFFNLNFLIDKLVDSYFVPEDKASHKMKINWVKNSLSFKLTDDNLTELNQLVDSGNWSKVSIVVTKLVNDKKSNWPLFMAIFSAISNKQAKNSAKLKSVLDQNWLEE